MGSVIPLKKSANSAYSDLKNHLAGKIDSVENLIALKLKSQVNLIKKNERSSFGFRWKKTKSTAYYVYGKIRRLS